MNRIDKVFAKRKKEDKLLSLFITAGYPTVQDTVDLILGFEKNGADLIELGIPFSDPLADGPTIQYSSEIAINNGINIDMIFDQVKEIRTKSDIPVVLMGYMNPVLKYGVERFCKKAAEVGVDGLILPDIPADEDTIIQKEAEKYHLYLIYLVAPNTTDVRMKMIDHKSQGFVYCVSVAGVTGARDGNEVSDSVNKFINRVKKNITVNPTMIGFGIKSFEDAQLIAAKSDGYIVGSALIETIRKHFPDNNWKENTFKFVKSLKFGT